LPAEECKFGVHLPAEEPQLFAEVKPFQHLLAEVKLLLAEAVEQVLAEDFDKLINFCHK
jgi:hypothetical protein